MAMADENECNYKLSGNGDQDKMSVETEQVDELRTIGQIARELDVPPYKISYITASRNIGHDRRVGILRLYGGAAVERIKAVVAEMTTRDGE
jgi:hypothetical protein